MLFQFIFFKSIPNSQTLQELRQKCIELQCSNERLYGEGEALRKVADQSIAAKCEI